MALDELPGQDMPPGTAQVRVLLLDADAEDHALDAEAIDPDALTERQLLWVDVEVDGDHDALPVLATLARRLRLGGRALAQLRALDGRPCLHNFGEWFLVQAVAAAQAGQLRFAGQALAIVCGHNFVVTLHRGALQFLEQLRAREHAETRLGTLSAESFTASLLDWQLDSYLHAVSDFEAAVDRLELRLLGRQPQGSEILPELAQLRHGASRLRRLLAPHRHVFGALARPDFMPDAAEDDDRRFRALEQRFERALDAVENTRELVVGSFELFTTRTAQRTNDTMRVLTFFTVLLGSLAVVAGVLGMNFHTSFFDSGERGFWTALAVMGAIALLALAVGRRRRWF